MKTHFVKALTIFNFLVCSVGANALEPPSKYDAILGHWMYSAPDAPYGYQEGTIHFKVLNDKFMATATIAGTVYDLPPFTATEDGNYTCDFWADGSNVTLTIKIEDKEVSGTATAEGMKMPITFRKSK